MDRTGTAMGYDYEFLTDQRIRLSRDGEEVCTLGGEAGMPMKDILWAALSLARGVNAPNPVPRSPGGHVVEVDTAAVELRAARPGGEG